SDAIMRALAKSPDRRTATPDAFVRELLAAPEASPPLDATRTATGKTIEVPERPRRSRARIAVALALALGLVAAVFAWRALTVGDGEADVLPPPRTSPRVRASPTPKAAT